MTHDRDTERLLDLWFAEGPTQAPDRVIDVVADRIGRHPQRPGWRLQPWRDFHMNTNLQDRARRLPRSSSSPSSATTCCRGRRMASAAHRRLRAPRRRRHPSGITADGLRRTARGARRRSRPGPSRPPSSRRRCRSRRRPATSRSRTNRRRSASEPPRAARRAGSSSFATRLLPPRPTLARVTWTRPSRPTPSTPSARRSPPTSAFKVTTPTPVTIGPYSGKTFDIELAPTWTGTCPWSNGKPGALALTVQSGPTPTSPSYGMAAGDPATRVYLLDVGGKPIWIYARALSALGAAPRRRGHGRRQPTQRRRRPHRGGPARRLGQPRPAEPRPAGPAGPRRDRRPGRAARRARRGGMTGSAFVAARLVELPLNPVP